MRLLTRALLLISFIMLVNVATAQDYTVDYETVACFEAVTADECGFVTVPEDRNTLDGSTIRIPVAITRSTMPDAEAIVFLSGGPGEPGLIYGQLAPLFPEYDLVVFDHRGVNLAEPALDCTEYAALLEMDDLELAELADASSQALVDCAARLRDEGINLNAYTTSAASADVFDIVMALGYEQVNLIGVSYGTRWAQEVMRDYPRIVKAAVLDSVIPPEIDRPALTARAVDESMQRVFAACAADDACDAAYPDLATVLDDLLVALDADPVMVTIAGEETELTGSTFMSYVFVSLYLQQGIAELPALIYDTAAGDYTLLTTGTASVFAQAVTDNIEFGLFFVTECNSEVAFSDPALQTSEYDELMLWRGVFSTSASVAAPFIYDLCAEMGLTDATGDDNDVLVSDIPTLLTAGEFDPVTPPSWLEQAEDGLSNAYAYEIPASAHSAILQSQCAFGVLRDFLADPNSEPDTSCFGTLSFDFVTG